MLRWMFNMLNWKLRQKKQIGTLEVRRRKAASLREVGTNSISGKVMGTIVESDVEFRLPALDEAQEMKFM